MIDNYKKFIGKICTVLTKPCSFPFKDAKEHSLYFTGLVIEVDSYGVLIQYPNTETIAYFSLAHIIGLVEEQVITKENPNYTKIKEELKIKKKPPASMNGSFTSVEELTAKVKSINSQADTR